MSTGERRPLIQVLLEHEEQQLVRTQQSSQTTGTKPSPPNSVHHILCLPPATTHLMKTPHPSTLHQVIQPHLDWIMQITCVL